MLEGMAGWQMPYVARYHAPRMERSTLCLLLLVLMVVLVVLLGLPLGIGMGGMASGGTCPDCDAAGGGVAWACAAVLGALLVFMAAFGTTSLTAPSRGIGRVTLRALDRPPRSP